MLSFRHYQSVRSSGHGSKRSWVFGLFIICTWRSGFRFIIFIRCLVAFVRRKEEFLQGGVTQLTIFHRLVTYSIRFTAQDTDNSIRSLVKDGNDMVMERTDRVDIVGYRRWQKGWFVWLFSMHMQGAPWISEDEEEMDGMRKWWTDLYRGPWRQIAQEGRNKAWKKENRCHRWGKRGTAQWTWE